MGWATAHIDKLKRDERLPIRLRGNPSSGKSSRSSPVEMTHPADKMRTLAIGDIHGCHTALDTLLKEVKPTPADQIVFLGDYIDRGPSSRQVIETLLELKKSCSTVFICGNHETMILDARNSFLKGDAWQSYGGLEALFSYGVKYRDDWASRIPRPHWEFFERTLRSFETKTHIFVHACVDPELDMKDQPDWILHWETFERMKPHKSGKQIICGHTVQKSGKPTNSGFAVCIDTGPASGGWLTCLDTDSGAYWQANEKGISRSGRL
jgi:serine/threonine protein phosphatase 1